MAMLPIDEAMIGQGFAYYRYMDDIRIATTSHYKARAALQCLSGELRKLGLNVNNSKTDLLDPSSQDYDRKLFRSEPRLEQIDKLLRSRSLPKIRRSFEPLSRLSLSLIDESRTQEPAFRFCVKRFESLALCADIDTPENYFDPMINAAIAAIDNQPHSTDQLVRFLKAAPTSEGQISEIACFLQDKEKAIYDWQNFLLWQLLVYKGHEDRDLLMEARMRTGESELQADRAGAMLYLGASGDSSDRKLIAERFEGCDSYLMQRNAIIGVHELAFYDGIEKHVAPHVMDSLKGTYRRLTEGFKGQYYRQLDPVSYVDIYDEVRSYD